MNDWHDPKYEKLSTAEISDALDFLGLPGSAHGLRCVTGDYKIMGEAFTVRFAPVDPLCVGTVGDFIDDVKDTQLIVLDNGGRTDCTVWGGILSQISKRKNLKGTVIHGVCRDLDEAVDCGYAIFSRGGFMRTGKDRVQVEEVGGPVSLGNVRVNPGDILVGDRDGIVVIPRTRALEVLERAHQTHQAELDIIKATDSGMSLREARVALGYHTLQRKQSGG